MKYKHFILGTLTGALLATAIATGLAVRHRRADCDGPLWSWGRGAWPPLPPAGAGQPPPLPPLPPLPTEGGDGPANAGFDSPHWQHDWHHGGPQSDHDRAISAVQAGEVVPLQQVVEAAERDFAGQLLEAELEQHHDRQTYDLKILSPQGTVFKLIYDASSGTLARVRGRDVEQWYRGTAPLPKGRPDWAGGPPEKASAPAPTLASPPEPPTEPATESHPPTPVRR